VRLGLEGKRGLVTGGSKGLGEAIASELVAEGARVAICSRSEDEVRATAAEVGAEYAQASDVTDPEQVRDFVARSAEALGGIDFLVNNAGGQFPAAPGDISDNGWRAVVDLNLHGTWNMVSRFAPVLVERGGGAIVNIVHLYSFDRAGPFVHSGAARAGVVQMTYTLAQMLGRANVRVNAIAPGTIDTLGMQTNEADVIEELQGLADLVGDVAANIPARRIGTPGEVAGTVLFLCSPAGRWINGVALRVDGGEYAGNWVPLFPGRAW
jgi:NAD(P)-dependent dehydrogenase (short-subunit alcohol dehydrogenase family)